MLYWSIVLLILTWGAAILASGPIPGPPVWIGKILAVVFIAGLVGTVATALHKRLKRLGRGSHGNRNRNLHRKRRISAGNQR
jgi:uncharacterized membrane protein YtjA (UPF0391 family)